MFIYNVKINKKKIFKWWIVIASIIVFALLIFTGYKIFTMPTIDSVNDENRYSNNINITTSNYTNILKAVHDNLNEYIGKEIRFVGYIYKVSDFNDNQFVLARDMVISSDFQTLVVGFLCSSKDISNYQDKVWVEISGKITKGDYHGEIPVIDVSEIKQVDKPSDEYVYPPDDSYIPTSSF